MKSFVIALLECELSMKLSRDCIDSAGNFDVGVEIKEGINGVTHGSSKLKEYGIEKFLLYPDKPGVIGCFLSHFELWKRCAELNEPILILEHDAVFLRPLPVDILDHFADLLRLDAFDVFDPKYNEKIAESLNKPIGYIKGKPNGRHIAGEFCMGTHAYIIKPNAARKLISFALTVGGLPADVIVGDRVVNNMGVTASVVRQNSFFNNKNRMEYSTTANLSNLLDQ